MKKQDLIKKNFEQQKKDKLADINETTAKIEEKIGDVYRCVTELATPMD